MNKNIHMLEPDEKDLLKKASLYCVAVPTLIDFETNKINDKPLLDVR